MPPDAIAVHLAVQVLLVVLYACFNLSNLAMQSLNPQKIARLAEQDRRYRRLEAAVCQADRYRQVARTAMFLCIFIAAALQAGGICPALTGWILRQDGGRLGITATYALVMVVLTLVSCVVYVAFGQFAPRQLARCKPERLARLTRGLVQVFGWVLWPVNALSAGLGGLVLRLFKADRLPDEEEVTEEEIRMLVDLGEENGAIDAAEKELIENVFNFNNLTAGDVMVHRTEMTAIQQEDTPQEIYQLIEETGYSRLPVYGEDLDDIVGIMTTRSFLLNQNLPQPKPLQELLIQPYVVPESVAADVLFRNMQRLKVHMAIVADEYGGTCGLVTMEDLLEQIVGNIYDESDEPDTAADIQPLGEGRWRVAGWVELEELAEVVELPLPTEEEYKTLGGLVFDRLSQIPQDGTTPRVEAYGLRIQVECVADRRVEWAVVEKLPDPPPEAD